MHTLGKLAAALLIAVATQQAQAVPIISLSASAIALHDSASLSMPLQAEDFAGTALAGRATLARPALLVDAIPLVQPNAYSLLLLGAGLVLLASRRPSGPWSNCRVQ